MRSHINYTEVDISTGTSQNVTTDDAELIGIWVTTALSAHAVTVHDGAAGTTIKSIPASAAVNATYEGYGVRLPSGINVACDALGTGKIIVAWARSDVAQ